MSDLDTKSSPSELGEILQRIFYLKSRLKVNMPESLAALKTGLDKSNLRGKDEGKTNFDLFYLVGIIFSRQAEALTMGELSRLLDVPLSTATRIVDWLVRHQYAQRLTDPEDRRIVRVTLTEAGVEMYRTINEFLMERIGRLLRQFTPEERETMLALLRKMIDLLEKEV